MDNTDQVIGKMSELQAQGVRFSLDDFGTGYSSLQYLKQLPLFQLKIDQSFVRDLETDSAALTIADSIVGLARSLNLEVIAEGVETAQQLSLLQTLGCMVYQGYLFSRPLPVDAFESFVQTSSTGVDAFSSST